MRSQLSPGRRCITKRKAPETLTVSDFRYDMQCKHVTPFLHADMHEYVHRYINLHMRVMFFCSDQCLGSSPEMDKNKVQFFPPLSEYWCTSRSHHTYTQSERFFQVIFGCVLPVTQELNFELSPEHTTAVSSNVFAIP